MADRWFQFQGCVISPSMDQPRYSTRSTLLFCMCLKAGERGRRHPAQPGDELEERRRRSGGGNGTKHPVGCATIQGQGRVGRKLWQQPWQMLRVPVCWIQQSNSRPGPVEFKRQFSGRLLTKQLDQIGGFCEVFPSRTRDYAPSDGCSNKAAQEEDSYTCLRAPPQKLRSAELLVLL